MNSATSLVLAVEQEVGFQPLGGGAQLSFEDVGRCKVQARGSGVDRRLSDGIQLLCGPPPSAPRRAEPSRTPNPASAPLTFRLRAASYTVARAIVLSCSCEQQHEVAVRRRRQWRVLKREFQLLDRACRVRLVAIGERQVRSARPRLRGRGWSPAVSVLHRLVVFAASLEVAGLDLEPLLLRQVGPELEGLRQMLARLDRIPAGLVQPRRSAGGPWRNSDRLEAPGR